MASALRTAGRWFGGLAGFSGIEHGYFELQQGDVPPPGLQFPSLGPPCDPQVLWHGCEPAISVLPSLQTAGIVSMALGAVTMIWAVFFMARRSGGPVLALLSAILLAVGGGVVPPVIGILTGLANIRAPRRVAGGAFRRTLASLWPSSLVAFFALLAGTVVVGQIANSLIVEYGLVILVAGPVLLLLSFVSAWARDSVDGTARGYRR